ncbi:MAG: multidrug resistance protein [Pseudonocardiales bacterium]|nr:multidrug resistance protein [Pseudonocardiales bacterium]
MTRHAAGPKAPLWRQRDFMLLWTSQVLSTVGTRVTTIAYPLLVLAVTNSPAQAGLVGFAQTLPYLLFYLPGGALIDRLDRKRVMIASEAGRAVALGSIAFAVAIEHVTIGQIAVVAFVEGTLFVLFDLGEGAALPHLVDAGQLPAALAQNQAKTQGADLIGQPLGGVLFSTARMLPFLADAVSYVVSLLALLSIRAPFQHERAHEHARLRTEIVEGLRFVWRSAFLRAAAASVGGMNFVFNALTLVLIVRAKELGASATAIGVLFGIFGAGGLLGSFVAPWVQRMFPGRATIIAIGWFWAAQLAVTVVLPTPLWLGVAAGIGALASASFNVVVSSRIYAVTPDRLLGRVRSSARLIAWGTIPLGALGGGVASGALGGRTTLLILAALMVLAAAALTMSRGVRDMDAGPPAPAEPRVDITRPAPPVGP